MRVHFARKHQKRQSLTAATPTLVMVGGGRGPFSDPSSLRPVRYGKSLRLALDLAALNSPTPSNANE